MSDELFDNLPYICAESRELFDFYRRIDGVIMPSRETPMFNGKIWILIDGANFSASDTAA